MSAAEESRLLALIRQQRQQWLELQPGLRVRFSRPPEADMGALAAGVTVEHVCRYVDGWEGFTEATLLGAAVGSSDPLDFSAALWAEYVRDRARYIAVVAEAIAAAVQAHLAQSEAAAKN